MLESVFVDIFVSPVFVSVQQKVHVSELKFVFLFQVGLNLVLVNVFKLSQ